MVMAASFSMTGVASGTATTAAPAAGATCDPANGPALPSNYICDSTIAGNFTLSELGTGTYTGAVRLDWSIWTSAAPCAQATGTVTFTSGADSVTTTLVNTSRMCESKPASDTYTMDMQSTVTAGTGRFASPTGGSFETTGALVKTATAGEFTSTQAISGSVTVADPTPTPTPTPVATASAAPTASVAASPTASATPAGALLPDTSTGGPDGGLLVVLALGVVVVASSTYGAMRRSAAR
jgi:hypothetical protein